MLNAVGREIPDEILEITGKEPFQGNNYKEGVEYVFYDTLKTDIDNIVKIK